jgi:uncharacterized membrane protein
MPGTRPGMTVMGRCVAYAVVGIGTARMKRRSSNVRHGLGETTKLASRRRPGRGSSWPGLSRPSTCFGAASKDVDTRHKAGHDGDGAVRRLRSYAHHDGAHETAVIKRPHGRARPRSFASRRRPGRGLSWPGLSRPSTCFGAASKDVDARHKAGHDGVEGVVTPSPFTRVGSLPCSVTAGHDGDGAVRHLRSSRLDYFPFDLLRCGRNDILPNLLRGMAHALDRECLGGAGSGAARLFSCARDVSLDQAARPQDLSQLDRKSQRFGCACRQSRLYNGFLAAGLVWGLLQGASGFGLQIKTFFLLCVLIAGVYGAVTVSRRILYVQAAPAALALILLWLA